MEQLSAVSEVLTTLGFGDFTIQLNHRELLSAMLEAAEVPLTVHGEALVAIDKLDKIGRDGVQQELVIRGVKLRAQRGVGGIRTEIRMGALRRLNHGVEPGAAPYEQRPPFPERNVRRVFHRRRGCALVPRNARRAVSDSR